MPGAIFSRTCKSLNIELTRKKFRNPAKAQQYLDAHLQKGKVAGCQVGVFHLNYLAKEFRFHFNAHNIVVYGKDDGMYLISDPVMENPSVLTSQALNRARFAKGALAPKGQIYFPKKVPQISDEIIRKAIVKGIKTNIFFMLKAPLGIIGADGIKYTANQVKKLRDKLGVRKAGLYLGQIIRMQEEIGTGGGGFRFMYAAFLQQAYEYLPDDTLLRVSDQITRAGDLWRDSAVKMAGILKGRNTEQQAFNEIAEILYEISAIEKNAFTNLKKVT